MTPDDEYLKMIELNDCGNQTRMFEAMLYSTLVLNETFAAPHHVYKSAPDYTTSVDAALKLVPHGLAPHMGQNAHHGEWSCWLRTHSKEGGIQDVGCDTSLHSLCHAIIGAVLEMYRRDLFWTGLLSSEHPMPHFFHHDREMTRDQIDFIKDNCTGAVRRGAKVSARNGQRCVLWGLRFENFEDLALFKLKFTRAGQMAA